MGSNLVRERLEEREQRFLAPSATRAAESKGRSRAEPEDKIRTSFMRDRDRILHSKSFRRLKDKTQVFITPDGDHYRTRLTHTLEVAQIARTIGRALALNEDLIEAIALGHDLGHTPFGHAGETALDEAIKASTLPGTPFGFDHAEQSLRVVDVLEDLNLTYETRMGIGNHRKHGKDLSTNDGVIDTTLEAAVVRISDRIAYINHDLDDALRYRIIPSVPNRFLEIGATQSKRISRMVEDLVRHSIDQPQISLSEPMLEITNDLKRFLFDEVYGKYPIIYADIPEAQIKVKALFRYFTESDGLPEGYVGKQGAVDYLAGMTDRFALNAYDRRINSAHESGN